RGRADKRDPCRPRAIVSCAVRETCATKDRDLGRGCRATACQRSAGRSPFPDRERRSAFPLRRRSAFEKNRGSPYAAIRELSVSWIALAASASAQPSSCRLAATAARRRPRIFMAMILVFPLVVQPFQLAGNDVHRRTFFDLGVMDAAQAELGAGRQ